MHQGSWEQCHLDCLTATFEPCSPCDEVDFMSHPVLVNLQLPCIQAAFTQDTRAQLCSCTADLCFVGEQIIQCVMCWHCSSLWPFNAKAFSFLLFESLTGADLCPPLFPRHTCATHPCCLIQMQLRYLWCLQHNYEYDWCPVCSMWCRSVLVL